MMLEPLRRRVFRSTGIPFRLGTLARQPLASAAPASRARGCVSSDRLWRSVGAGVGLLTALLPLPSSRSAEVLLLANRAATVASAAAGIRADQVTDHVRLLADDTLEGREAGSRGGYAAGNYLARFVQATLQPAGDSGQFFQMFAPNYRNLLGVLPGSDPELRDEYILLGAHYDHVGYGSATTSRGPIGSIHNGADDNASGTAAVLEILQAFTETRLPTRRSILFALWDGEEKGLLGSQHFIQNPTIPLAQIRLALNVDMIGRLRNQQLEVYGTRTMAGLRSLVSQANQQSDLRVLFPWRIEANSDHQSFFARQIPILTFHTGLHEEYHRPSDDVELVNAEGVASTAKLIFRTVDALANADELPTFRLASTHETDATRRVLEAPSPPQPPRLGIRWEALPNAAGVALQISQVIAGSDADRAGLRPGDRITHVDGLPLRDATPLQQRAVTATELQLTLDAPREVTIRFSTPPTKIGISWREDPAEPGALTIVRVVPHSPAELAGLALGDRILQFDGRSFANGQEFAALARECQLPAPLVVERLGQLMERRLPRFGDITTEDTEGKVTTESTVEGP